jgi:hypothetical protein
VTVEHVATGQVIDTCETWVEHDDAKKQELASHERRHITGSSSNINTTRTHLKHRFHGNA